MNDETSLPPGWTWTTVEELKLFAVGGDWGHKPSEEVKDHELARVIRATEFKDWQGEKGRTSAERLIKTSSLKTRRLGLHDFVVEVSGGGPKQPVGRTILIDEAALKLANGPLICSNFCRLLRLSPEIWPPYVKYFLDSIYKSGIMDGFQTQTTNIRNLKFDQFLQGVKLPLAPLAEQKRIAAKLEELLSEIESGVLAIERARGKVRGFRASLLRAATTGELSARWRADNPVEESGAALLGRIESARRAAWEEAERAKRAAKSGGKTKRLFEDESWKSNYRAPQSPAVAALPALPDSWCWASLEQLADISGGITKGQKYKETEELEMVPYLRVANVQRGELDLREIKEIAARPKDIEALALRRNDILFNEGGDRDKLGRGWIWEEQLELCLHQNHVFRARLRESAMQAKLVSWCGNSYGRKWFSKAGKQTTNLASINMTILRVFPIPLPPLAEQEWIVAEVERRLSLASEVEATLAAALRRASALKALVLARAFRGELCAQDDGDESADALLKRIRAARAEQPRRASRKPKADKAAKVAAQGTLF